MILPRELEVTRDTHKVTSLRSLMKVITSLGKQAIQPTFHALQTAIIAQHYKLVFNRI